MARYRSWSDTALRGFEDALDERGIRYVTKRYSVDTEIEVDALAAEWGLTRKVEKDERRRIV